MARKISLSTKIFAVIIVLMPLLNSYSISGMPGSLADLGLVIITILILMSKKIKSSKTSRCFVGYLVFLVINCSIYMIMAQNISENLKYYIRNIMYITIIIFGVVELGDLIYGIRALRIASLITCAYCWLQLVGMKLLNVYFPSYLPFLEHRADLDIEDSYLAGTYFYRPHSLFAEPSIFCEYIIIYLVLLLTYKEIDKVFKDNKLGFTPFLEAVFVTATCMITGSTTGIVTAAVVWSLYFVTKIRRGKIDFRLWYITLIPVLMAGSYYIVRMSVFQIFIQRTFIDRSAIIGRLGAIENLMDANMKQMIFGRGIAFEEVYEEMGWLPGFGLIYAYFGIIGIVVVAAVLLRLYFCLDKNNFMGKMMLFIFVIMNCTSYPLFSSFFLTDIYFVILSTENSKGMFRYDSIPDSDRS